MMTSDNRSRSHIGLEITCFLTADKHLFSQPSEIAKLSLICLQISLKPKQKQAVVEMYLKNEKFWTELESIYLSSFHNSVGEAIVLKKKKELNSKTKFV